MTAFDVRSRRLCAAALPDGGLDRVATPGKDGAAPNLRWIYRHMIEKCARHNGHADILRGAIDGLVGEQGGGPAHVYSAATNQASSSCL